MIRGVHTMFYSSEPEALRAFFRDKLGFPASDVGQGWLIFDLPEADLGCHPAEDDGAPSGTPHISFYCDDINKTVAELCQERQIDVKGLAEQSGVDEQRVLAIVLGRWTPSPSERDRIAGVFGLTREQITWGHKTPIQHIYGHGPG